MIKIYKDTKFYVFCPGNVVSGGAELLHQLVSLLRDNGREAYIVYYSGFNGDIPSDYKKYNIEYISDQSEIVDNDHHIEVLFEPMFYRATYNTKTQKILWWLSVDNFFRCSDEYLSIFDIAKWSKKQAAFVLIRRWYSRLFKRDGRFKRIYSLKDIAKLDVVSAYQSEYAQNFLQKNGFREMFPLKDYINTEHCVSFSKEGREDIILYNPKKGLNFTKHLIDMSPDLNWVPIINMTRQQVIELMGRAKIYVDFGFHPGKDRLPRECAMNGLCVITGYRGSARYFEDIWIDNEYKFDEKRSNKQQIIKKIRETLNNYDTAIDNFAFYRYRISLEKQEFEREVSEFLLESFN